MKFGHLFKDNYCFRNVTKLENDLHYPILKVTNLLNLDKQIYKFNGKNAGGKLLCGME